MYVRARPNFEMTTTRQNPFRRAPLARAATLPLVLAVPAIAGFAGAAHADDEYGTGHETLVQQSAHSAPSFGRAFALATGQAVQPQAVAGNTGTSGRSGATDAAAPPVEQDLLGTGRPQDNLAPP